MKKMCVMLRTIYYDVGEFFKVLGTFLYKTVSHIFRNLRLYIRSKGETAFCFVFLDSLAGYIVKE